jgi:hypothetical protein
MATTETNGIESHVNRLNGKAKGTSLTKFGKLFALASKAERKTFTIRRETSEGAVLLKLDGFPASVETSAVARLAETNGGRVSVRVSVGESVGIGGGVLAGVAAGDMVRELTSE